MVRTASADSSTSIFTDTRNRPKRTFALLLALSPGSHHYGSSQAYTLEQIGAPARIYPDVSRCSAEIWHWCRNINLLPFRCSRLRNTLGSTNPRLTNIAEEPWPLRRNGFSPFFAATPTRILIRTRSTRPHGLASTHARHLLTRSPFGALQVSVLGLAPSIFRAHNLDW